MRGIKTRKRAKREQLKNKIFAYCFLLIALAVGIFEFLLWYFVGIPGWLFGVGEVLCIGLLTCSFILYDAAEEEASKLWEQFDI